MYSNIWASFWSKIARKQVTEGQQEDNDILDKCMISLLPYLLHNFFLRRSTNTQFCTGYNLEESPNKLLKKKAGIKKPTDKSYHIQSG